MPDVIIYMKEGRTADQKRQLAKEVTNAIVNAVNVSPDTVEIVIVDAPPHNFARGGILLSDKQ